MTVKINVFSVFAQTPSMMKYDVMSYGHIDIDTIIMLRKIHISTHH